ncbi:MAG: AEC family transporter [Alphaproteobacteria bacterium]
MSLLFEVVTEITLPIVLMIGGGYVLQRRLALDVATLSRLTVYGTLPCLLVVSLATAPLPAAEVGALVYFTIGQFFIFLALGWIAAVAFRLPVEMRPVLALAAPFAYVANYGIPLVELSLGPAWVPYQAIITAVLTVLIFVLAPVMLNTGAGDLRRSAVAVLRTPVLPAVAIGLALNILDIPLPRFLEFPLRLVGNANTPVALIALGAMLPTGQWLAARSAVSLGVALRLLVGPLLTWLAVSTIGLPDGMGVLFLVGAAAPVGILLPILCAEYGRQSGAASAMVVVSTAISPLAVTAMVYLARAF